MSGRLACIATKISEHQKTDSPVEQVLSECCGSSRAFEWRVIDQCNDSLKLMTLEDIYIAQREPALNTRDEYRSRELTLKYYSTCTHVSFFEIYMSIEPNSSPLQNFKSAIQSGGIRW